MIHFEIKYSRQVGHLQLKTKIKTINKRLTGIPFYNFIKTDKGIMGTCLYWNVFELTIFP